MFHCDGTAMFHCQRERMQHSQWAEMQHCQQAAVFHCDGQTVLNQLRAGVQVSVLRGSSYSLIKLLMLCRLKYHDQYQSWIFGAKYWRILPKILLLLAPALRMSVHLQPDSSAIQSRRGNAALLMSRNAKQSINKSAPLSPSKNVPLLLNRSAPPPMSRSALLWLRQGKNLLPFFFYQ